MSRFLQEEHFETIIIIDNSASGMSADIHSRLVREYGRLSGMVSVIRAQEISSMPRALGWDAQQVLKLAVSKMVHTKNFVLLDAKNHLVDNLSATYFLASDGRLRTSAHSYQWHSLRRKLERVLKYLNVDPTCHIENFTATVTPFVLDTEIVKAMIADVEEKSGRSFAHEFLRNGLTEFFLYIGWIISQGYNIHDFYRLDQPSGPIVWPEGAHLAAVSTAVAESESCGSPFFSVHRSALATLPDDGVRVLTKFWTGRGLFPSDYAAEAFISEFRRVHHIEGRVKAARDRRGKVLLIPAKLRREISNQLTSRRPKK